LTCVRQPSQVEGHATRGRDLLQLTEMQKNTSNEKSKKKARKISIDDRKHNYVLRSEQ